MDFVVGSSIYTFSILERVEESLIDLIEVVSKLIMLEEAPV